MEKLREILEKLIAEESGVEHIEVEGETMEEALRIACEKMGVSMTQIDYEVIEFGNPGFIGLGKKKFKLKVYKSRSESEIFNNIMAEDESGIDGMTVSDIEVDRDGECFVRLTSKGVMLKVTSPTGSGKKVKENEVVGKISFKGIAEYNKQLVKKVTREACGEYIAIGRMNSNVVNDSTATVSISSDEMKAFITITAPKEGGYELDMDEIKTILKSNNVVVGILDDRIEELIDYPVYNEPVLVAEGIKPKRGEDAHIDFKFRTERKIELKEEKGKVNFKELNLVQNVVAGQILAVKVSAKKGEPGRTVTNNFIDALNGKDVPFNAGKNTSITNNGLTIIAARYGQVVYKGGSVIVEEVYTVEGDVNAKTGNITFLGTIIVKGSVDDGYKIKATGNVEVIGGVGKCEIDTDGDVIVHQGIQGKNEAVIRAGNSVFAKFIENVEVLEAGEGVYAQDGILQSKIDAAKEVTCLGKRGRIVGGRIRAGEVVNSKVIGSQSGTPTMIEVGIDPRKRQYLEELEQKKNHAYKELDPIEGNLLNLQHQKKTMKKLSADKIKLMRKLIEDKKRLEKIINGCEKEIEELQEYLAMLKNVGKVVGSITVYPGVKIYIKESYLDIKTEYKKQEFYLNAGEVDTRPYDDSQDRDGKNNKANAKLKGSSRR